MSIVHQLKVSKPVAENYVKQHIPEGTVWSF